ncbi:MULTISPECIES: patatin-like phospholipase family protein [Butyricimonas]|uniref:patatin-like phospholipase family protein n=1 Tax=Butyricimonas TaxID=574697 RepID=UPI0007FB3815|nr:MULTISPECIES: patatin-like phospholipase family protein [Butyricimonas]
MKRSWVFLLVLFLVLDVQAQRKKVGLVLSGGGAKGVAHIGVLKVLEEAGIPIDYIAGTSMGSIVGALYAIGYDSRTMDSLVRAQDWMFLLSDKVYRYNLPFSEKEETEKYLVSVPIKNNREIKIPSGFISGQNIYNLFSDLTIGYHDTLDFHKLQIPFACVASNLVDGQEVVQDHGVLPLAMRASMAIPGVFAPVRRDGMVLVDGGISNNFPVDIAKQMGADIIIGVDVQAELKDASGLESVTGIIDQMTSFLGIQKYEENKKMVNIYIKPDVYPYSAASFSSSAIDTLIARGEEIARSQWDELMELKRELGIPEDRNDANVEDRVVLSNDTLMIERVRLSGIDDRDEKWLRKKIRIKDYSRITLNDLHHAIAELYGIGAFSSVSYKLSGGPVYDLELTLKQKPMSSLNLGFRFDSEEMAAILLNTTISHKELRGSRLSLTGRLSMNPYVKLNYSLGNTFLRRFELGYTFKYNNLDIYNKNKKQDNVEYAYHKVELGGSDIYFRNFKLQIGARYEYFNYESFMFSDRDHNINVKPEGFFSYHGLAHLETFDKRYYPTRGMSLKVDYSLYTDNLLTYNDGAPFSAIGLDFESVVSITRRVKFIPSIYGRVLIGRNIPYPYLNCMGGDVAGRYVDQQLPFLGIQHLEIFDNSLVVAKIMLRYNLGRNHYISLAGNYAKQEASFFDILGGKDIFGGGVGYSYDSFVGPIDVMFSLSDWSKKLGFYFNLGYYF